MLKRLRTRLVISHALPILLVIPVLGFILLNLLVTSYFFGNIATELTAQARLISEFIPDGNAIWSDPAAAEKLVNQLKDDLPARMMLLDSQGRLVTSSVASDNARRGQAIARPIVQKSIQGESQWRVEYNEFMGENIIDVTIPVVDNQNNVVGVVRLSRSIAEIQAEINPWQWMIAGAFFIAILTSVLLGQILTRSITAPLSQLIEAVQKLKPGLANMPLSETGPEEIRILSANFNQLAHRLRQSEFQRRLLVTNIAHELGTALGAIKAAAHAIPKSMKSQPEFTQELVVGINSQIDQLSLLIDDLVLLEKAEASELTLRPQQIDVVEFVKGQCQVYSYLIQQKEITFTSQFADKLPMLIADETRLSQILANLLQNAYRYTPVKGRISVSVDVESRGQPCESILIRVYNTGDGIRPEEKAKIFQLFYRGPDQRDQHHGMGIGLALSRHLAEVHSGTLTVESEIGQGATFILSLPTQQIHG